MGGIGSGRTPTAVDVRFARFIEEGLIPPPQFELKTPCWNWTGQLQKGSWHSKGGYGRIKVFGKTLLAHRVAYALAYGEVPDNHDVDHKCNNRRCVNPDHLEATTHAENVRRIGIRKKLTKEALLNEEVFEEQWTTA